MELSKRFLLFLFILCSYNAKSQIVGAGGQVNDKGKIDFAANLTLPYFLFQIAGGNDVYTSSKTPIACFGVDYTIGTANSHFGGLQVKPIIVWFPVIGDDKNALMFNADGGYLFNFKNSKSNGITLSPGITYISSISFLPYYIKLGGDWNATKGKVQGFLRIGFTVKA